MNIEKDRVSVSVRTKTAVFHAHVCSTAFGECHLCLLVTPSARCDEKYAPGLVRTPKLNPVACVIIISGGESGVPD